MPLKNDRIAPSINQRASIRLMLPVLLGFGDAVHALSRLVATRAWINGRSLE